MLLKGVRESFETQLKTMVVVFTITEINYLVVGLFCDLVRPCSYLILGF